MKENLIYLRKSGKEAEKNSIVSENRKKEVPLYISNERMIIINVVN